MAAILRMIAETEADLRHARATASPTTATLAALDSLNS